MSTVTFKKYFFEGNRWPLIHLLWILGVSLLWGLDLTTKFGERSKFGAGPEDFRLWAEQLTSALGVLVMIYFVAFWQRISQLYRSRLILFLPLHILGLIIFAVGHYAIFVTLRAVSYGWFGENYVNDAWFYNFVGELQKDVKIYLGVVLIISLYRFYGFKQRASSMEKENAAKPKMLVKTGVGEAVIEIDRIEYVQAARNYVVFHTQEREYLVRDTFENCLSRLGDRSFVRVHRSYSVNSVHVSELLGSNRQKQAVRMKTGTDIPIGKTYQRDIGSQLLNETAH